MIRRTESPPAITRADVGTVVITVRRTGDAVHQKAVADVTAADVRGEGPWPVGLLSWSLFTSTDGQALMAYEQWAGDEALDAALALPVPYLPGIPGTEPSAPVRYRLHRSHVSDGKAAVGCVVTPVFDVDGPERQRHFVDEVFAMTKDMAPIPGSVAAHFHSSLDGTRVFNYAEWSDEQAHVDAVTADDPRGVRRRLTGEIAGVRPCGYRRWYLHTTLVSTGSGDDR